MQRIDHSHLVLGSAELQRTAHDHAHGVFEVGALHLLMQGDRFNALLSHSVYRSLTGRRSAYR